MNRFLYSRRRLLFATSLGCCAVAAVAIAWTTLANGPSQTGATAHDKRGGDNAGGRIVSQVSEELIKVLAEKAKAASKNAYCHYSDFPVGAAILTEGGNIFTGCNVENASFGLAICAERNAVFQMVAQGERRIKAVVLYTPTKKPTAPCGACRQVINEFGPDALIVCTCDSPAVLQRRLADLMPDPFGPSNLK